MNRLLTAVAAIIASAGPAAAHSPIAGVGAFYNGMLHPLLSPSHALVVAAVGLICGQHAPRVSRFALPAFALALGAGLLVPPTAVPGWTGTALLATAGLLGLAIAVGTAVVPLLAGLAILAGLALGLDTASDPATAAHAVNGSLGTWFGAVLWVTLVGGLGAHLTRAWQRIGLRALGSWIAAASVIVLAFTLSVPPGSG